MSGVEITDEEVLAFDANAAGMESRRLWLMLGKSMAAVVETSGDWLDDNKAGAQAMEWAAQAEACFWRATGDMDCPDIDKWVEAFKSAPKGGES